MPVRALGKYILERLGGGGGLAMKCRGEECEAQWTIGQVHQQWWQPHAAPGELMTLTYGVLTRAGTSERPAAPSMTERTAAVGIETGGN
jgi:hypothetical protein